MKFLIKMCLLITLLGASSCVPLSKSQWAVHDLDRPQPAVVAPGERDADPPSDAIVLFDGTDLSAWKSKKGGGPAKWKVEKGYMEVVKKTGYIQTVEGFGSCQLHIEWATPKAVKEKAQKRGNSGVFFMGKYELQILDSYDNTTYPDGQAAAIYGQNPPLVNASRKPGQWQSYDIIFQAPVFKGDKLVQPGTLTAFHNGVLVQDHWVIKGTTYHKKEAYYTAHDDKLPLSLQNHGDPMRFRNIWIRPLQ